MALYNIMAARQQVENAAGQPLGGGKVYLFAPGTTSFITSYEDSGLVTPHTNPVTLNGSGRSNIWISRDCDIRIDDRNGNVILQELNANPDALDSGASGGLVTNGSFENDINADNIPDNWDLVNETGSTNARDITESTDGAASMRFTSAGANGGGNLTTSDFFPVNAVDNLQVNFDIRCTSGTPTNKVVVEWYDISQVSISDSEAYSATAIVTYVSFSLSVAPPALSRFAKLKLVGVDPAGAVAASTFFDKVSAFYPAVVTGTFDNITILDNQIQSDNTNGHIQLRPNGTGSVEIFQDTPTSIDLVDEEVPLIIGASGGAHVEFDDNEIQAKASATTTALLGINALGGNVSIGAQSGTGSLAIWDDGVLRMTGEAGGRLSIYSDGNTDAEQRGLIFTHQDGTTRAALGSTDANANFIVENLINAGDIRLRARDTGATVRTTFLGDPDGESRMYHAGIARFATGTNGSAAIRDDASSDVTPKQLLFEHQDGTLRGFVGYGGDPDIALENRIDSGHVRITGRNSVSAPLTMATFDPDDDTTISGANGVHLKVNDGTEFAVVCIENNSVDLYHDNIIRTRTQAFGQETRGNVASGLGAVHNTYTELRNEGGANRIGFVGFNSGYSDAFFIHSDNSGRSIVIDADDLAGVPRTILNGDPDGITQLIGDTAIQMAGGAGAELGFNVTAAGQCELYHSNTLRLETNTVGTVDVRADGTGNLQNRIRFLESAGALKGVLGFDTASPNMTIANEIASGHLILTAEDAGFVQKTGLTIDPDALTTMNGDTGLRFEVDDVLMANSGGGGFALYSTGGQFEFASHDHDLSGNTSGASIEDGNSGNRNVGFNEAVEDVQATTYTFLRVDVGRVIRGTSATARTWTIPATNTDIPPGAMWIMCQTGAGTVTINDNGNTLNWLAGSSFTSGDRTLDQGGVATLWKSADNVFYIWGNGGLT